MKKQQGFTFIELLVVIAIIGVVFAVGVVSYTSISLNSRNARRISDLEAIRQALEMCRSVSDKYPTVIYPSVTCPTPPIPAAVTLTSTPLDPKYSGVGGTCPSNGQYVYTPNGTQSTYTLSAGCYEGGTKTVTNP